MPSSVSTSFNLNRGRIASLLRLPGGLVDRNLRRRVERVQAAAERLAPGSMGRSISSSFRYEADGPVGVITLRHPAAVYVTGGTRPHVIRPRNPNGVLRFEINGRVVYAKFVNHPGTRPNRFMIDALRQAL
jgi:hypothetical protein